MWTGSGMARKAHMGDLSACYDKARRGEASIFGMMRQALLTTTYLLLTTLTPAHAQTTPSPGQVTGHQRPDEQPVPEAAPLSKVEQRRRLARCGAQWQKMKWAGTDAGMIWRDFAATCLKKQ